MKRRTPPSIPLLFTALLLVLVNFWLLSIRTPMKLSEHVMSYAGKLQFSGANASSARSWRLLGITYDASDYLPLWDLSIPYGYPIALTALVPMLHIWRQTRRRNLARLGRCPSCGYDLRATPGRCPECGWGQEPNPTS